MTIPPAAGPLGGFVHTVGADPNRIGRTVGEHFSLLGATHRTGRIAERTGVLTSARLAGPAVGSVTGEVRGWDTRQLGPYDEVCAQAALGTMAVHARARGRYEPLGVDYLSVNAGIMLTQGLLALAVGRLRGLAADHVRLDMPAAALLPVTQYIAGATATEDAEKGAPDSAAGAAPPPFRSADGVWFELECLSAEPWQRFWTALGAPAQDLARSWKAFLLRYPLGTAALSPSLHTASRSRTFVEIRELAARAAGVNLARVRSVAERRADPDRAGDPAPSPWRIVPAGGRVAASVDPPPGSLTLPLQGVIVVESCRRVQGPLTGRLLRLLGATVLRVEVPGGDPLRGMPPMAGGCSARFVALNDDKQIIEIDIKAAVGRLELLSLVSTADVFLHNWAPGKAGELGLTASDMHRVNPSLVYARASGWGRAEPPGSASGTDFMVQAHSGVAERIGSPATPRGSLMTLLDILGGQTCAQGILAALLARQLTGSGQCVNTSLLDAAEALLAEELRDREPDSTGPLAPLVTVIAVADGALALAARTPEALVRGCRVVGVAIPESGPQRVALPDVLACALVGLRADDAAAVLHQAGVAAAPVRPDLASLSRDPWLSSCFLDRGCAVVAPPWRFE